MSTSTSGCGTSKTPYWLFNRIIQTADNSSDANPIEFDKQSQFELPQDPPPKFYGIVDLLAMLTPELSVNSIIGWNKDVADRIQSLFDDLPRIGHLKDQVGRFLCENPELIDGISETKDRVPEYFGHDAIMSLRLVENEEDKVSLLTLGVKTSFDVDSAFDALNRFEDEWYLPRFEDAVSKFVIDLRFV